MRSDMAKVIVERPRYGSRTRGAAKGYRRSLQRMAGEEPAREGMKARHRGGTKSLNEHLGPLRRYLDAQVGRPWDKVFAEICARIDRSSAVQDHVRDHVADYVVTQVVQIDGVLCDGEGGWSYGRPLHDRPWRPWYVCPRTGLLRRVKFRRRTPSRNSKAESIPPFIPVSDSLQCRLIEGAWHVVSLRPLPLSRGRGGERARERDVLLDCPAAELQVEKAREQYGAVVYAAAKRRLTRRELPQFPIPARLWD